MTGGDAHNEQLISAYLDGELTSDERQHVEQLLASNADYRQLLADLRAIMDGLRQLPRLSLDEGFVGRVIDQTRHAIQTTGDSEPPEEASLELLSAYLDDELSSGDVSLVRQQLEANSQSRQYVQRLRALDSDLRALPKHTLDEDFADRVLRRAERTMLVPVEVQPSAPDEVEPVVTLAGRPASDESRISWRGFIWSAAAVAAAVVLALLVNDQPGFDPTDLAVVPVDKSDTSPAIDPPNHQLGPRSPSPQELAGSGAPDTQVKPPSGRTPDSAWPVVLAMRENARQRLILVYEVSVTSLGVEQGAFARLLTRHNIGFRETVAVEQQEQRSLLKQRFLEGAELAPAGKEGMDEVRLYLVSCTGNEADLLYQDLAGGPPGFASFSLNLTSGEAGGGVLNRVCDASQIGGRSNEAIRLLASFAMMSETARNLGVFGSIEWVDPELLQPPPQSGSNRPAEPKAGQEDVETPAAQGDFQCELLFVVRNIQPAPKQPASGN